jgi:hypothetical protein
MAIRDLEPLSGRVERARAPWRSRTLLAAVAAATGMSLLLAGIQAITGFVLLQQRRGLAIRLAVGAEPKHLVRVFWRSLVAPVACGTALGMFLGWVGLSLLRWQLYGVGPAFAVLSMVLALCVPLSALALALRAALKAVNGSVSRLFLFD